MNEFKPENPQLWELCMKHGSILAKREKVTQVAILEMYDEIQQLQNTSSNSDYAKCQELLQIIKNSEAIKATPAVALFVVKEKLEKHFA